jgi:hypothetical protein
MRLDDALGALPLHLRLLVDDLQQSLRLPAVARDQLAIVLLADLPHRALELEVLQGAQDRALLLLFGVLGADRVGVGAGEPRLPDQHPHARPERGDHEGEGRADQHQHDAGRAVREAGPDRRGEREETPRAEHHDRGRPVFSRIVRVDGHPLSRSESSRSSLSS